MRWWREAAGAPGRCLSEPSKEKRNGSKKESESEEKTSEEVADYGRRIAPAPVTSKFQSSVFGPEHLTRFPSAWRYRSRRRGGLKNHCNQQSITFQRGSNRRDETLNGVS
jgi:hypothetical protein